MDNLCRGDNMKNNSARIMTTVLIFIIIVLIAILITGYYYLNNKNKNEYNHNEKSDEADTLNTVPTSDLVSLYYEANNEKANIFYAYIEDGYLYYFNDYVQEDGEIDGAFNFISSFTTSSNNKNKMKKYTKLNNIRRIKTYNVGTSVDILPILITESGEIYTIDFYNIEGIKIEKYDELKNYKIDDILSCTGEMNTEFKLLLKDGTIRNVTIGNEE